MCEHLGVYSHAILTKRIQTIWNLHQWDGWAFVRVEEVGY